MPHPDVHNREPLAYIYLAAFVAAFTAIAYELVLASYATFLLGATIFQYSFILSLMMASMGTGALLTQKIKFPVRETFLAVELLLAVVAAIALPVLYYVFAADWPAQFFMGAFVVAMGLMIGTEIPLLNEITSGQLSRILFFDYLGGFLGGLLFPVFLVQRLGLFRVSAILAVLNALVAVILLLVMRGRIRRYSAWATACVAILIVTVMYCAQADVVRQMMEFKLFAIKPYEQP